MRRFTVTSLGPEPPQTRPAIKEAVAEMKKHWDKNLDQILPDQPDLIVLPECCDRFPAMPIDGERKEYYAERGNAFLEYFSRKAADNNCAIAYSAVRRVGDGTMRNVTTLLGRDGREIASYYKFYPVVEAKTIAGVIEGNSEVVADTEFGKVGFAICFDLNYMELLDRYVQKKPELMLFASMYHGGHVQSHWAYSCRSFFVGSIPFRGQCAILDPLGIPVASATNYHPYATAAINTDYEVIHLDYNRDKILAARKKYGKRIRVSDPGYIGAVLVYSEDPDITAAQMVDEFEIERLDDYFNRVRKFYGRKTL